MNAKIWRSASVDYAETSFATGIGPPDLGPVGNILIYGGLFLIAIVLPIAVFILVLFFLIKGLNKNKTSESKFEK